MAHQEIKLEIREVGPMIVARLGGDERDELGIAIATMSRAVADHHPEAFEKFKVFAADLVRMILVDMGAEVHGVMEQPVDCGAAGHA